MTTEAQQETPTAVLVSHPLHGSVWLNNPRFVKGKVVGEAWDRTHVGFPFYPEGYVGEPVTMHFPVTCIRKRVYA